MSQQVWAQHRDRLDKSANWDGANATVAPELDEIRPPAAPAMATFPALTLKKYFMPFSPTCRRV